MGAASVEVSVVVAKRRSCCRLVEIKDMRIRPAVKDFSGIFDGKSLGTMPFRIMSLVVPEVDVIVRSRSFYRAGTPFKEQIITLNLECLDFRRRDFTRFSIG
jgi:hypothetical protein